MYFIFQSGTILVLLYLFSLFLPLAYENTVIKGLFELLCQTPIENLQIRNCPQPTRTSARLAFQVP